MLSLIADLLWPYMTITYMHICCVRNNVVCLPLHFKGYHLLNASAMDAKLYARALLDVLFSKEEQSRRLVYAKRSADKELLDPNPVWQVIYQCAL